MHRKKLLLAGALVVSFCGIAPRARAIDHITIKVVENTTANNAAAVTLSVANVSTVGGAPTVSIVGGDRGDYNIQFGESRADDQANGIMLASVAQNSSASVIVDALGVEDRRYSIAAAARSGTAGYFVATHDAFQGVEWNVDVSAVYFPFADGWIAGHTAGAVDTAFTSINATAGLQLGNQFVDGGNGKHTLNLSSLGVTDHARQGLLFVSGGANADNFALSGVSADGTSLGIYTRHITEEVLDTYQQQPVAFAYIPAGVEGITMGKVNGQGNAIFQQGNFTVTRTPGASSSDPGNDGVYTLTIAGQTPETGTLLFSAESTGSGASGDNMVTAEPNGQGGWTLTSRDTPVSENQPGLQNVGNTVPSFNFAFIPNNINESGTVNGGIRAIENWDPSLQSVYGGNVKVTENGPGNENVDTDAEITSGSPGVGIPYINRGDYSISVANAYARGNEGVMFATPTEINRDNSGTGGASGAGVVATSVINGKWEIATHTNNGNADADMNIDFAVMYVQSNAKYAPVANAATPFTPGVLTSGVDSTSELTFTPTNPNDVNSGVLLATASGNNDNYATVGISGNSWKVERFDNSGLAEDSPDGVNHLYVPYSDTDTVAARIAANGSVLAGDASEFSLTNPSPGIYHLTIDGVTPNDGMLLLNSGLSQGVLDNETRSSGAQMSYVAGTSELTGTFIIQALGVQVDNDIAIDAEMGSIYQPVNTPFSFAYFSYGVETPAGLVGDYNGDGTVNLADYTVWRDNLGSDASVLAEGSRDLASTGVIGPADYQAWKGNFGNSLGGLTAGLESSNVPEPTTYLVLVCGLAGAWFVRQRSAKQ